METAIGVFASRDRAEQAVGELRRQGVPEQSLVFLTRSENEAKTVAQELGAFVGGFTGGTVGMTTGPIKGIARCNPACDRGRSSP